MDQSVQSQPLDQPQPAQEQQTTVQPPTQSEGGQEVVVATTPEGPQKSSRKIPIFIIIFLVLFAAGGALVYFLTLKPKPESTPTTQRPTLPSPTPQPQATHYLGSQTITLRDVSGGTSTGSTTRSIIPGNVFRVVYASLPDPPEGQFYQAWVVGAENNFFGIGKLSKDFEGVYTTIRNVRFDSSTSYTFDEFFNTTIVTLESVDDEVMETRMLEGTFTQ